MISICIKSYKKHSFEILEEKLGTLTIPKIYYLQKRFKYSNNLIIHYTGKCTRAFFASISSVIADYIIENYEESFLQKNLDYEYFYFSNSEKKHIKDAAQVFLHNALHFEEKKFAISTSIQNYFVENKILEIDGFINFRLYAYRNILNTAIEKATNEFVIQKEYSEYVNLLKDYINLQPPQTECIHLVYANDNKLLLDNENNVITNTSDSQIYLSDISFSSNDFVLNSLLTLLPQKIYIHLIDKEDNFIEFLKLIFAGRYSICDSNVF